MNHFRTCGTTRQVTTLCRFRTRLRLAEGPGWEYVWDLSSPRLPSVGRRAAVPASALPHQVVQEVDLVTRRRAFGRRNKLPSG
jgi:hypothetical protein